MYGKILPTTVSAVPAPPVPDAPVPGAPVLGAPVLGAPVLGAPVPGTACGSARRAARVTSQQAAVSRTSTPMKTAPCALNAPEPLSQWPPSGAPNSVRERRMFGPPATAGERKSR